MSVGVLYDPMRAARQLGPVCVRGGKAVSGTPKPKNRTERVAYMRRKLGRFVYAELAVMTDRQVATRVKEMWPALQRMPDVDETDMENFECLRCHQPVEKEVHFLCGCGRDRSVFDEQTWVEDLKNNSGRRPEDIIFLATHDVEGM